MSDIHPWPMNLLTREAGASRKLIVKPLDITPRSNIRPDSNGILRVVDVDKIKLTDAIVVPEMKEAGHFHFYCRDADGDYHVFGRKQNVNGYYIDIYDKIADMHLPKIPKETVIAMELVWPKHPDSQVPTAIKDCPDELRMRAFGVPIYQGALIFGPTSLPYGRGRKLLQNTLPPEVLVEHWSPVEFGDKFHAAEVIKDLLCLARQKGIEGFVLKQKAYDGWWKIKGVHEADVFITGFHVSESDTQGGLITSVDIGVLDEYDEVIHMGSVTGFSLEEKEKMTKEYKMFDEMGRAEQNRYYFRPMRVLYQEIAGKGKLKHGFFDCWRDDEKSYDDCKQEQFL